jgi:O-antigen/teichoic acid export membrane protein
VNLATGNVTTVLLMGGKSSWNLFNAALSLALNVGLNLLLTPRFGVNGAAIAWAASLIFVNVAPVVQVRLFLGLRPPLGAGFVVVALAVAICYGGLGLAVRHGLGMSPATLAIFAVSGTGLYAAALWRFRALLHIPELLGSLRLRARRRPPTASPGSSVVAPAVEGS